MSDEQFLRVQHIKLWCTWLYHQLLATRFLYRPLSVFLYLWVTRKVPIKYSLKCTQIREKEDILVLGSNPSTCFFLTLSSLIFEKSDGFSAFTNKQSDLHETAVLVCCAIFPKDWPFDALLQDSTRVLERGNKEGDIWGQPCHWVIIVNGCWRHGNGDQRAPPVLLYEWLIFLFFNFFFSLWVKDFTCYYSRGDLSVLWSASLFRVQAIKHILCCFICFVLFFNKKR